MSTPYPTQPYNTSPGYQPLVHTFDGGAASYLVVGILSWLITVLTLGICLPWAIKMRYQWVTEHTLVNGQPMTFTGSAIGLFGHWIKWFLLIIITLGIYTFWVTPRLWRWRVENQHVVILTPSATP